MPPKRKLASNALKGPEVDAAAPAVPSMEQRRRGESVDRQMKVQKTIDKYGTSSRVLRSQTTNSKGDEPRTCDVEEHKEAHVTKARGKKAKEGAGRVKCGLSQNEVEAFEHLNGDNGNPVARTHVNPGKECSAPIAARGKAGKKNADQENRATSDMYVNEDEGHAHLTKARGKTNKRNAPQPPQPAAQVAEEQSNAEETNGSNGSEAPKEEKKRGRKGKPNASKSEPEPVEKKAKIDDASEEPVNYDCEKTNKKGEKWNLKISTWNVASLRACVKKGMLDYVAKEDADIVCFQETKCSEKKAPAEAKVEGYHTYWCSGKNDGYAGVALFTKEKPLNVDFGIGEDEMDTEGRIITAEYEKFYLVTTYVPNAGQGLKTLPKRMKWDDLFRSYLKKLDGQKPVVLCGDLNVAHEEIDLKNPKTNTKSAGFTPEERANFTKLLGEGFVDSFRHFHPEKTGAYTFWAYFGNARANNTGWRLDYFVLSERLMESVCDVVIRSKVLGSDHCPVTMFIHI